MKKFRFKLDDIVLQVDPNGWENLASTIKRDNTFNSLLLTQDAELEFFADGYDYIKSVIQKNLCNNIRVIIQQNCGTGYETIHRGLIFVI